MLFYLNTLIFNRIKIKHGSGGPGAWSKLSTSGPRVPNSVPYFYNDKHLFLGDQFLDDRVANFGQTRGLALVIDLVNNGGDVIVHDIDLS